MYMYVTVSFMRSADAFKLYWHKAVNKQIDHKTMKLLGIEHYRIHVHVITIYM